MKYVIITLVFAVGFWFGYWLSWQARPDEVAERHIAAQQAYIAELEDCIYSIAQIAEEKK